MSKLRTTIKRPLYRVYERRLESKLDRTRLPRHIGVIHDGHRRYARSEGLADYKESYRAGMRKFLELVDWSEEMGIPAVTCWLLSKENLTRPTDELAPYFDVLVDLFAAIPDRVADYDVSVRFIGSLDLLPARLVEAAKKLEEECPTGSRRITIALAYGGRQEIVDAARDLITEMLASGTAPEDLAGAIDAAGLASHLYTADLPDPDLVIRTSGEARLSGFLLWQSAYAEYVFVDVFWPAFRRIDFLRALRDFSQRDRRYGR